MSLANFPITAWSGVKKAFFRFCFVFFTLYILFNSNGFFLPIDWLAQYYIKPFHSFIVWSGKHIFHLSYPITAFTNGSGDTTYDWLMMLLTIILAFSGAIIWTIIDRRRTDYNTLNYWLTAGIRYYFAFTMFTYGFAKVFKLQFPFLNPYGLSEAYGNSSPMHLAWSFLGYSKGHNYFMGFAEIGAGALLLFRRTIRVGAILGLVVAMNIMVINYCFDVCVKLLSTALVLMVLYIAFQGWEHHLNFFFLNRDVKPESLTRPVFRKRWINISLIVFKILLIGWTLFTGVYGGMVGIKEYGDGAPKPPLYGLYNVQTFVRNQDTVPPLATDTLRWHKLMIGSSGRSSVMLMNDSIKIYSNDQDSVKKRVVLKLNKDSLDKADLSYSFPGKDVLLLAGKWNGDSIRVMLKKYDVNNFLLVNRGFHFINETPMNK